MKSKAAYFGVLTALALIFSYVETWIVLPLTVPGIKLGLANLVIVLMLYRGTAREALLLSVTRILLAGFLFGNLFSILYSMAGGLVSLGVMVFIKKMGMFSTVGVSIAGGVSHNLGQLLMAAAVTRTVRVSYYLPVLLIAGVLTGFAVGIAANEILRRIRTISFTGQKENTDR